MNIKVTLIPNPTIHVEIDIPVDEAVELEHWMSAHTGPSAPTVYKGILVELRKIIDECRCK